MTVTPVQQGRLPDREEAEHAEGDPIHSESVSQGQDLAPTDEAE